MRNSNYKNLTNVAETQNLFMKNLNIPKINQIEKEMCDTPLQIQDYEKALLQLANDKTPGSDGLSTNFYKFFWADLCDLLIDSYNYSFKNGELSQEQ